MSLDLFQKRTNLVLGFSKNEFGKLSFIPLVILQLIMLYLESIYRWNVKIADVPSYLSYGDLVMNAYDDGTRGCETFIYQTTTKNDLSLTGTKFRIGLRKFNYMVQIWLHFDISLKQQLKQFVIEMFWKEKQLHGTESFSIPSWFTYFTSIGKISGAEKFTDFTEINLQFKIYTKTENE